MNKWAFVFHPSLLLRRILRKFPWMSTQSKLDLDLFPRPYYAYGLHQAARQAKRLGIDRISAIEFGVAAGAGLLTLEQIIPEIEKHTGVKIDLYGFDTGQGLPQVGEARDLPYVWQRGFYKMDRAALEAKLKFAKLIIGPVKQTIDSFCTSHTPAPIGFVSFDMDFYTSTCDAFELFKTSASQHRLPRVFCFFDDIIGKDDELHCQHVGELAAIAEFNASQPQMKLGLIHGLAHKRIVHMGWCEQMYVLHDFAHPQYANYIGGVPTQLPLSNASATAINATPPQQPPRVAA